MKLAAPKREQQALVGAILCAGVVLWVYYAYLLNPLSREVARLGQAIQANGTKLQFVQQSVGQIPQLREEYRRLSESLKSIQTALPSEEGMPTVIERLSDLASQTGVKIRTVFPQRTLESLGTLAGASSPSAATKPPAVKPPELYKEIPIQIDALAGFHQLGAFLSRVESGAQPMQLKTLRINGDPKEPRRHTMKIVLTAYFTTSQRDTASGAAKDRGGS